MAGPARAAPLDEDVAFLQSERGRAAWWNWSWRAVFVGGIVLGGVQLSREDDPDKRINHKVAIGKASIALVNSFVMSLTIPEVGPDGVEAALRVAADNERRGRGWWPHVSALALNLGASLYLGIAEDNWRYAAFSGVFGAVIGEARIFTQPYRAVSRVKLDVAPVVLGGAPGLVLVGEF